MALIQCPNCGKEISDKAQSCVYCGCIFSQKTKKTCPECGNELEQDVSVCLSTVRISDGYGRYAETRRGWNADKRRK